MARSTYIYFIIDESAKDSKMLGAFTVKHECVSQLRSLPTLQDVWVGRIMDGKPPAVNPQWTAAQFLEGTTA